MADISLDEVIRQRGLNTKQQTIKRPMFGRGAGASGRGFDARQKIGANDVRQRIGLGAGFQVKDAREKIGQKDARFRIRGGGGGGVQDARQMINSRKQVQHHQLGPPPQITHPHPAAGQHHLMNHMSQMHIHTGPGSLGGGGVGRQFPPTGLQMGAPGVRGGPLPSKPLDARDRLSLKRGIGASQSQMAMTAPFKITKTIQQRPVGTSSGIRLGGQQSFTAQYVAPIWVMHGSQSAPERSPHTSLRWRVRDEVEREGKEPLTLLWTTCKPYRPHLNTIDHIQTLSTDTK